MNNTYIEEYYLFQIDQLYKDQSFIQEMMNYDYHCIKKQVAINESKLVELMKSFFKWIIQKFNDMKDFLKKVFSTIITKLDKKIDITGNKCNSIVRILHNEKNNFVLKNEVVSDLNFVAYEDIVKSADFKYCKNIDIAQRILDFYLNIETNRDKIEINVPTFVSLVKSKGYAAACSENLFNIKMVNQFFKNNFEESPMHNKETMKRLIYQSIYGGGQDKDLVTYQDITVDRDFVVDLNLQTKSLNTNLGVIKDGIKSNEKALDLSKKKIENIEKKIDGEVISEDIFKSFKIFTDYFIKLFNYNRDILVYLCEISNSQISYIDRMLNKIEQHLRNK